MSQDPRTVNLLWTGGWDSTFRLLQLLLLRKKPVQPHYLIDVDRKSTGAELYTMRNIKKQLFSRYPKTRALLCETNFFDVADIPENLTISKAFQEIRQSRYMGSQYEWLARYCLHTGLEDIELSIHRDDQAHKVIEALVIAAGDAGDPVWQVSDRFAGSAEYTIFSRFRFPIFNLSKVDMEQTARKEGFLDIMEKTWFCYQPLPNYTPCGVCNPCMYTIQEGLGRRVPLISRLRYYLSPSTAVRRLVMGSKPLYAYARRLKQRSKPG